MFRVTDVWHFHPSCTQTPILSSESTSFLCLEECLTQFAATSLSMQTKQHFKGRWSVSAPKKGRTPTCLHLSEWRAEYHSLKSLRRFSQIFTWCVKSFWGVLCYHGFVIELFGTRYCQPCLLCEGPVCSAQASGLSRHFHIPSHFNSLLHSVFLRVAFEVTLLKFAYGTKLERKADTLEGEHLEGPVQAEGRGWHYYEIEQVLLMGKKSP